ncbi:MAG: hypothetical protein Q8858_01025 [Bacteroidota bacterium]|nr:hypothetical protein [Bacteroidota bacterium]
MLNGVCSMGSNNFNSCTLNSRAGENFKRAESQKTESQEFLPAMPPKTEDGENIFSGVKELTPQFVFEFARRLESGSLSYDDISEFLKNVKRSGNSECDLFLD